MGRVRSESSSMIVYALLISRSATDKLKYTNYKQNHRNDKKMYGTETHGY